MLYASLMTALGAALLGTIPFSSSGVANAPIAFMMLLFGAGLWVYVSITCEIAPEFRAGKFATNRIPIMAALFREPRRWYLPEEITITKEREMTWFPYGSADAIRFEIRAADGTRCALETGRDTKSVRALLWELEGRGRLEGKPLLSAYVARHPRAGPAAPA